MSTPEMANPPMHSCRDDRKQSLPVSLLSWPPSASTEEGPREEQLDVPGRTGPTSAPRRRSPAPSPIRQPAAEPTRASARHDLRGAQPPVEATNGQRVERPPVVARKPAPPVVPRHN
jgi:hypothetical protein